MGHPRETGKSPKLKDTNLLVNLPSDLVVRFQQRVPQAERDAFVQRLLEAALQQREPEGATVTLPATTEQPDWDLVEAIWGQIPDGEFEKLPPDGSKQHDHYLYGVPKREP